MPIVFYYMGVDRSCRAVEMTAEHLGIQLVKKTVDLSAGEHMKPEFLKMNPQHCIPTIDDDGFILWESRAIMSYLIHKYAPDSPLYPKDPKERALVDRMLYYDTGTLCRALGNYYLPHFLEGKPLDPEKEKEFKTAVSIFENILETSPYAAGKHLTLADYSILANLVFAEEEFQANTPLCVVDFRTFGVIHELLDISFSEFPKISVWLQRMKKETPRYKEINEVPLREFKKIWKEKGYKPPPK